MKNILCLNKIAAIGTDKLDRAEYNVGTDVQNPDAILVRSAAMHDMTFGPELQAIGRAGAGVNNIPVDRCSKEGIVVFNTPGANANGVKELAVCALMLASEQIFETVWKEDYLDSNNTVMVHIRRIREKLKEPQRNPNIIKTVWGVGYKVEK